MLPPPPPWGDGTGIRSYGHLVCAAEGDQPEENSVILTDGWSQGQLDEPNVENGAAPPLDPHGNIDESDHGSSGSQSNEDPTRKEDDSAGERFLPRTITCLYAASPRLRSDLMKFEKQQPSSG